MTHFLTSWRVFDGMTRFLTSIRVFHVITFFHVMTFCSRHFNMITNFLTWWWTFWRYDALFDVMKCLLRHDAHFGRNDIFVWRHEGLFDVMTCFWRHDVFLTSLCTIFTSWRVFDFMTNLLTSWRTFWHDELFDVMMHCLMWWRVFDVMTHFVTSWRILTSWRVLT